MSKGTMSQKQAKVTPGMQPPRYRAIRHKDGTVKVSEFKGYGKNKAKREARGV